MIPKMTKFSINGVEGTVTRDIAYYDRYNITLQLADDIDLSNVIPVFETMNNDPNLLDGTNCHVTIDGVEQISGVTPVDFSQGDVTYTIDYNFMGNSNPKLTQQALVTVSVSH